MSIKILQDSQNPTPERIAEAQKYHEGQLKGASPIAIYADMGNNSWWNGIHYSHAPYVCLTPDDPYYTMVFSSREAINLFIGELQAAADKAFGKA